MKTKVLTLAGLSLVTTLALSGCATPEERIQKDIGTSTITVDYKGKPLDCTTWSGSHGELGMTCDFVKYHANEAQPLQR